jgi:ribosomal protein S12 methylthiotransferase
MSRRVYIETLGCAKNEIDSEIMLSTLLAAGFSEVGKPETAEVIIINTCGFITSSAQASIDCILELAEQKKTGQCQHLIVVGCLVERYQSSLFSELPEIDQIFGTRDYTQVCDCLTTKALQFQHQSEFELSPVYEQRNFSVNRVIKRRQYHAYIKIAEGCSNMCSFCNIPLLRGPYRSKPENLILDECKVLLENGIREISIISQDSAGYGADLCPRSDLSRLLEKVLTGLDQDDFWVRVFYNYPNRLPERFFDLMNADPRLVRYLDMPLQHIANPVLKAMNRKITGKQIRLKLESVKKKVADIAIRTTLMVGFPNETEKDFRELVDFVAEGYFQHIGVFEYSAEDNNRSNDRGDPIPVEEKKLRRRIIMETQQKVSLAINRRMIGQKQKVLLEGTSSETEHLLQGRNQYQGIEVDGVVLINDGSGKFGTFHQVLITEAHPYDLIGRIIQ